MVFVLNKNKKPINPCHPATARKLLSSGKAVVYKVFPFTIRLKSHNDSILGEYYFKIDPGSSHTGIAIVEKVTGKVVTLITLNHKSYFVKRKLYKRKHARRNRRQRKTRYRKNRYLNRKRPKGWLAPSLRSIINNIVTMLKRYLLICPINKIYIESVKFDTQLMKNSSITNMEYLKGTLLGYDIKEYLLYKYKHKCQYCNGKSNDFHFVVDHRIPKCDGGPTNISNLVLSCYSCNQEKGKLSLAQWLDVLKPKVQINSLAALKISNIKKLIQNPIDSFYYSEYVNITRKYLVEEIEKIFPNVYTFSGGLTKFNRCKMNLNKTHYFDALCVGKDIPNNFIFHNGLKELVVTASGRGSHNCTVFNNYGFPIKKMPRNKLFYGFQSSDFVRAIIPNGKFTGIHYGIVGCRSNGRFNIRINKTTLISTSYKNLTLIHRYDGYRYYLKNIESIII